MLIFTLKKKVTNTVGIAMQGQNWGIKNTNISLVHLRLPLILKQACILENKTSLWDFK